MQAAGTSCGETDSPRRIRRNLIYTLHGFFRGFGDDHIRDAANKETQQQQGEKL